MKGDGLFHGKELDAAMRSAEETPPPDMPICPSALDSRTKQVIDRQIQELTDPEVAEEIRKALIKAGAPFNDETVAGINLRSTIGGTFTMGIATGLALANKTTFGGES